MTNIKPIETLDEALWEKVARNCPYATFFHTPYWARAFHKTYPNYLIDTRGYILEDGAIAILPLMRLKSRFSIFTGDTVQSMFPGVYGGVISDNSISNEEARRIYESLLDRKTKYILIMDNPFYPTSPGESYKRTENSTHVLYLEKGFEQIWDEFSHGNKRGIKKARKLGVTVRTATTIADVRAYYQVYADSLQRWGKRTTSRYPCTLFENLYQINPEHVKLWLTEVDGKVVSGALVLYWNRHVVPWHGCSISEYFKYSPMNILQSEIIRDACERGYTYYDFNPSGVHEGSARFKELMGAEMVSFAVYTWRIHF